MPSSSSPAARRRARWWSRWGRSVASAQGPLHEHAVHPAAELEPHGAQRPHALEAERGVQVDRGGIGAVADYGDELPVAERLAALDQRTQHRAADPTPLGALAHINRILERIAIRRPAAIRRAVAIADERAAEIRGKVGQPARAHIVEAP